MAATDRFGLNRALVLLTDPDLPFDDAIDRAWQGALGGATHIVLRRPGDTPAVVHRGAIALKQRVDGREACRVLVHDRVDIAISAGAHGAVVPLSGVPGRPAKEVLLGDDRMLGISVHSLVQARAAQAQRADFVIFGNVYETESHPGRPPAGVRALAHVVENIGIPVIAIGGITPQRVDDVLAAGASGVAVIRAISRSGDPAAAARSIRKRLDAATCAHLDEGGRP